MLNTLGIDFLPWGSYLLPVRISLVKQRYGSIPLHFRLIFQSFCQVLNRLHRTQIETLSILTTLGRSVGLPLNQNLLYEVLLRDQYRRHLVLRRLDTAVDTNLLNFKVHHFLHIMTLASHHLNRLSVYIILFSPWAITGVLVQLILGTCYF